jgi:hypothetical protein
MNRSSRANVRGDTALMEDPLANEDLFAAEEAALEDEDLLDVDDLFEDEVDEEEDEEELADEEEESEDSSSHMGSDELLDALDGVENSPLASNASRIVREMRKEMLRGQNRVRDMEDDVSTLRSEFAAFREEEGAEASDASDASEGKFAGKLPTGVRSEQMDTLMDMLAAVGVQTGDERSSEENSNSADSYVDAELVHAVERYGSSFGTRNKDGSVTVNAEIQPELNDALESLRDPKRGVTPADLYAMIIARKASSNGGSKPKVKAKTSRARVVGGVAKRSGTGGNSSQVTIRKEGLDDSPDAVFNRGYAKAQRTVKNQI